MSLRSILAAGFVFLSLVAAPAAAQPADPAVPTVDQADLSRLVETLEDPAARDRLIADLKALLAVQHGPAGPSAAAAAPAEPDLGGRVLRAISDSMAGLGVVLRDAGTNLGDPQRIVAWVEQQVERPDRRELWVEILFKLLLVLGAGTLAAFVVWTFGRRAERQLEGQRTPAIWHRLPLLLARALLSLLPVVGFAAAAYAVLAVIGADPRVRLVMLAAINAAVIAGLVNAVGRFAFSPYAPSLRLFAMDDHSAAYAYIWLRRLTQIVVYGYFALQAAVLLGLPASGYAAAARLIGLVVLVLLIVLVLQNRLPVHRVIAGNGDLGTEFSALRTLRRRLAEVWHILAIFYLIAFYVVWAFDIAGGFEYMLRSSVMTLLILLVARILVALAGRGINRLLSVNQDLLGRYPQVEERANRYLPHLRRGLLLVIELVALLAVLAAWQVDVGAALTSEAGRAVIGRVIKVVLILVMALAVWEAVSVMVTIYLERKDAEGNLLVRSARARTLLPLLRNALLVLIALMAVLTTLSEIGVDIAPLLAGAGVAGLAIGFGAQALVKDVITGAFILFEDTVSIGDVATINGTGGLVEAMTIRTVRLRDLSGVVHTIPFGSINTVSNLTKDFSYYLLDVGVAYRENTDEVLATMREVFDDLRSDPAFGANIIGDFEVLGVDRFADSAVYVRARIKTKPIKQWDIGREYNRRMKMKFDERGIEIPFPHQTIYFGEDKQGRAPPLRLQPVSPPASSGGAAGEPPAPAAS